MIDEGPGEHDQHLMDEDEDTVPCPSCGRPIWAEAEKCPRCGQWLTGQAWRGEDDAAGARGKRWWWWVAVVMLIILLIFLLTTGDIFGWCV